VVPPDLAPSARGSGPSIQPLRVALLRTGLLPYFGLIQGLCVAFLIFAISTQLNQEEVQPRLLKRITLLYCNQQIRKLVDTHNNVAGWARLRF